MKFALKAFIILCLVSFWVWGIIVEPYLILDYDNVEIPISKWDKNLDGLKVALVSDIHAGAGPAGKRRSSLSPAPLPLRASTLQASGTIMSTP